MATYRVVDANNHTWNHVQQASNERDTDNRGTRNEKRKAEADRKRDGWMANYRDTGDLRVVREREEGDER